MKSIRVDQKVWDTLQKHSRPLEDSPNSVLRRLLRIDPVLPVRGGKKRIRQAKTTLSPIFRDKKLRLEFHNGVSKEFNLPEEMVGAHISNFYQNVYAFITKSGGTEGQVSGIRYTLHKAGYYVHGPKGPKR